MKPLLFMLLAACAQPLVMLNPEEAITDMTSAAVTCINNAAGAKIVEVGREGGRKVVTLIFDELENACGKYSSGPRLIRLDDDNCTGIQNTLIHEIGHALGLRHSSDPKSIMFPYVETDEMTQEQACGSLIEELKTL